MNWSASRKEFMGNELTWSPSESFVCPVRTWVSGTVSSCSAGRQPPRGSSLSMMSASVAFGLAPIRLVSATQV